MRVADPLPRGEERPAFETLDAGRVRVDEKFGEEDAATFAETFVINGDAERRFDEGPGRRDRPVEQGAAEALRVRLGDEAAGRRGFGQDAGLLELFKLLLVASRAEYLQRVAHLVDLGVGEVAEDAVEELRQAEPLFAADEEASDALSVKRRLASLARRAVGCRQDGQLLDGQGRRCRERLRRRFRDRLLLRHFRQHRTRTLETFRGRQLIGFQHFLQVRIVHLAHVRFHVRCRPTTCPADIFPRRLLTS